MTWRRHSRRLLLAACVISAPAQADVSFHGFGQVVVGSTLSNNHDVAVPTNLQYHADPRFDQESLLALQVDAPLSDRLSATAQIVSRADNDYSPRFELAYAKADIGDDWFQVMAGRQRLPLYMHSTYLSVGQSYIWMRPPLTVYFEPVENFDGISLYNTYYMGDNWSLKPQAIYGAFDVQFSFARAEGQTQEADFSARNVGGGAIELNYKTVLRLRAEYFMATTTTTTSGISALLDSFRAVGLNQTADLLDDTDKLAYFRGGGIEYKPGKWLLAAEYVQSAVDHSYVPKSEQYYLTAGLALASLKRRLPTSMPSRLPAASLWQPFRRRPHVMYRRANWSRACAYSKHNP